VDTRAKALGVSRNRLIQDALEEKVGARDVWSPELVQMLANPISAGAGKDLEDSLAVVRTVARLARPRPSCEIRPGYDRRKRELERRLVTLLAAVARAEWSDEVSRSFGELKAELERRGERVDDFGLAIAAHAIAHDATVVTRNARHFVRIRSLRVEDWT
jgi:predicted nucleic acid-binding protein